MVEKGDAVGETPHLAFVTPRYSDTLVGGAETLARSFAEQLVARDMARVTVLTTCANELGTWRNVLPSGQTYLNGVEVFRFPVDHIHRNPTRSTQLHKQLVQSGTLQFVEQFEWVEHLHHSPELYWHLRENQQTYQLTFFIPYLFGTSYYGSMVNPQRTIIWPCLHDELFAYLVPTRRMMEACCGVLFNSQPEQKLAERLGIRFSRPCVVGAGFEDRHGEAARFRQRQQLHEPFVLYAGRWDPAKNVAELLTFFLKYKERHPGPLKLVLMGSQAVPVAVHPDIVPLGFQTEAEKLDVYAAAEALIQPSLMESFSIVIMEAWLSGTPVIVPRDCPVTAYHVRQSGGGLQYRGFAQFAAALHKVSRDTKARQQMGQLGRAYVLQEYNWDAVLKRFDDALAMWLR